MMSRVLLPIIVLAIASASAACGGEDELPATRANVQAEVLNKSCNNFQGCHGAAASPAGQLDLSDPITVAELMRPSVGAPSIMLLVPGSPETSHLVNKLRGRNIPMGETIMPPGQPLDEPRLTLVERWIAAGAPQD